MNNATNVKNLLEGVIVVRVNEEELKSIMYWNAKGYNNTEISKKTKINRSKIQQVNKQLRKMKEQEFKGYLKLLQKEKIVIFGVE